MAYLQKFFSFVYVLHLFHESTYCWCFGFSLLCVFKCYDNTKHHTCVLLEWKILFTAWILSVGWLSLNKKVCFILVLLGRKIWRLIVRFALHYKLYDLDFHAVIFTLFCFSLNFICWFFCVHYLFWDIMQNISVPV